MSDQSGVSSEAPETPAVAPEATPAETPSATPAPDFDRIYERMDQMSAQQQQLAEQFGQAFASPEEEEPDYYDETGDLTEDGIRSVVSAFVDERLEAAMAPRERAAAIDSRDNEWEALKAQFPELENRELANAVIGDALAWANNHNPELIDRREFVDVIEWVYRARKYEEFSQAQQAAEPQVVLESAAGAARPTKSQGIDWQQRIIDAAQTQTRI